MDVAILRDLGLTEGEIKVYLALLEHGSSKTGEISKISGVHTSKVYPILDRLTKKGLSSYTIKNGVRHYQSSDPEQLISLINRKKRRLEDQETQVRNLIPEIIGRQKLQRQQSAQVYEGMEGVRASAEMLVDEWRPGDEYLVFALDLEMEDVKANAFFKKHHLSRIERGIKVKIIALESQRTLYKQEFAGVKNITFRYTNLSLPVGVTIMRNKVMMLMLWEPAPSAFVIDSEFFAQRYRVFFKKIWKLAKE